MLVDDFLNQLSIDAGLCEFFLGRVGGGRDLFGELLADVFVRVDGYLRAVRLLAPEIAGSYQDNRTL